MYLLLLIEKRTSWWFRDGVIVPWGSLLPLPHPFFFFSPSSFLGKGGIPFPYLCLKPAGVWLGCPSPSRDMRATGLEMAALAQKGLGSPLQYLVCAWSWVFFATIISASPLDMDLYLFSDRHASGDFLLACQVSQLIEMKQGQCLNVNFCHSQGSTSFPATLGIRTLNSFGNLGSMWVLM